MDEIIAALKAAGIKVAGYGWSNKVPTTDYAVWKYSGSANSLSADNHKGGYALEAELHLFRRSPSMVNFSKVEAVLNASDCAWYFESEQYESDSKLIHDEWIIQIRRCL